MVSFRRPKNKPSKRMGIELPRKSWLRFRSAPLPTRLRRRPRNGISTSTTFTPVPWKFFTAWVSFTSNIRISQPPTGQSTRRCPNSLPKQWPFTAGTTVLPKNRPWPASGFQNKGRPSWVALCFLLIDYSKCKGQQAKNGVIRVPAIDGEVLNNL